MERHWREWQGGIILICQRWGTRDPGKVRVGQRFHTEGIFAQSPGFLLTCAAFLEDRRRLEPYHIPLRECTAS